MNTHTLSISSTKEDIDSEITLNQIDLFDFTELTLDISNIYTEIFPTYVSINWGDGSDVFNPDIKIYRDYRNESILVMKNKYLVYKERVARQVFIIFISNTNNLETSSADLNTSLLFGSATLERKRDAAKTIRYI